MYRFVLSVVAATLLALSPSALAQDDAEQPARQAEASDDGGREKKSDDEKWCKDKYEGPEAWGCKRSISPSAGVSAIGELRNGRDEAELLLGLGGSVSIMNWQRDGIVSTKVVAHGKYMTQGGGRAYDVGLAGFVGARWKWGGGLAIGAEIWRNYFDLKITQLAPTTGIDVPLFFELGPEFFHLVGGLSPSFVFNPARRVEWGTDHWAWGFGHELSWWAGVETQIRLFTLALAYERHWMADGVMDHGVTLGLGF